MILVSPLRHIERLVAEHHPAHSLSLLAPWQTVIFDVDQLPRDHLVLAFNDIATPTPGCVMPDAAIVGAIIDFGRACRPGETSLVHCWMGVSRSPAAAFIGLCALDAAPEIEIAQNLRRLSPSATPNKRLVELADALLSREGRMVRAIESIGRGAHCFEGEVFGMETA